MANATLVNPDNQTAFGTSTSPFISSGLAGALPTGAVAVTASSGNVAAAVATASLPAVVGKTNYCSGFEFTAGGATAAAVVISTLAGTINGTLTYIVGAPLGAGVPASPLVVSFNPPVAASAVNTAITFSAPSLGVGNTNACATVHGYVV